MSANRAGSGSAADLRMLQNMRCVGVERLRAEIPKDASTGQGGVRGGSSGCLHCRDLTTAFGEGSMVFLVSSLSGSRTQTLKPLNPEHSPEPSQPFSRALSQALESERAAALEECQKPGSSEVKGKWGPRVSDARLQKVKTQCVTSVG